MAVNPNVNKVEYNGQTLIDLTGDTVTSEQLASGATAHSKNGEQITGTATIADRAFTNAEIDAIFANW